MSFQKIFKETIKSELGTELNIVNPMAIPTVSKVVINVGAGEAVVSKNVTEKIAGDIALLTGQKPIITKARVAVSAFKIRRGQPIGVKVTLRGARMYDFLEKLFKIVLPRIRDFRGIPVKSFDGAGNLNIGLPDQTLFPEIDYDKIDKIRGLEITIVTSTKNKDHAKQLLQKMGLVFQE